MTQPEYMPLMRTGLAIRMDLLDEPQAQRNHGQTLAQLRERGGLSPCEALALAKRRKWQGWPFPECMKALIALTDNSQVHGRRSRPVEPLVGPESTDEL